METRCSPTAVPIAWEMHRPRVVTMYIGMGRRLGSQLPLGQRCWRIGWSIVLLSKDLLGPALEHRALRRLSGRGNLDLLLSGLQSLVSASKSTTEELGEIKWPSWVEASGLVQMKCGLMEKMRKLNRQVQACFSSD